MLAIFCLVWLVACACLARQIGVPRKIEQSEILWGDSSPLVSRQAHALLSV